MAGVLDSVNQRTQLVGQNRLELLMFNLDGKQIYGINVFKVREVLPCPRLTSLPYSSAMVRGVAHIRGRTISVLDLGVAIGRKPLPDSAAGFIIITEYNNSVQGFLVSSVDRIANMNWEEILSPPKGSGRDHYLTAVTRVDEQLVEILDVERILAEVSPIAPSVSDELVADSERKTGDHAHHALIVDDSSVARGQIRRCCESVGLDTTVFNDGRQAWRHLEEMLERGEKPQELFTLVISDIEMPEMDGYTLTASIKNHPELSSMFVLLHTSLSGIFNRAMVEKVGADDFLAKFHPDELAERITQQVREWQSGVVGEPS